MVQEKSPELAQAVLEGKIDLYDAFEQLSNNSISLLQNKPITIYNPTPSSIKDAKELVQTASPELVQAVATDKIPLMQAHAVASSASRSVHIIPGTTNLYAVSRVDERY